MTLGRFYAMSPRDMDQSRHTQPNQAFSAQLRCGQRRPHCEGSV